MNKNGFVGHEVKTKKVGFWGQAFMEEGYKVFLDRAEKSGKTKLWIVAPVGKNPPSGNEIRRIGLKHRVVYPERQREIEFCKKNGVRISIADKKQVHQ